MYKSIAEDNIDIKTGWRIFKIDNTDPLFTVLFATKVKKTIHWAHSHGDIMIVNIIPCDALLPIVGWWFSMLCYQANPYKTADKICFWIVEKDNFIYSDLLFGSKVEMSQFQNLISKLDFTKSNLLELKPSDLKACSSLNTNCLYILFISIL